jgi:hypothetical protein
VWLFQGRPRRRQTAGVAADRDAEALRRFRLVRLLMPIAVVFFGAQSIVQFARGMTLPGIALAVCAGLSAVAGVTFFLMRNLATAPTWPTEAVEPVGDTGVVSVRRLPAPYRDRLRAYDVLIDDAVVGAVRDGDEICCSIPAGDHVIRVKIDWSGSRPLSFSLAAGQWASFECEPSGGAGAAIRDLLLRRPWVELRENSRR